MSLFASTFSRLHAPRTPTLSAAQGTRTPQYFSTNSIMASTIACPVVIKVQISSKMKSKAPAVAARLQARDFPSRTPTPPEATARKELVIAQEKARKAALAAAHNMRVQNRHAIIAQMQEATSVYLRETIDRRLQVSNFSELFSFPRFR